MSRTTFDAHTSHFSSRLTKFLAAASPSIRQKAKCEGATNNDNNDNNDLEQLTNSRNAYFGVGEKFRSSNAASWRTHRYEIRTTTIFWDLPTGSHSAAPSSSLCCCLAAPALQHEENQGASPLSAVLRASNNQRIIEIMVSCRCWCSKGFSPDFVCRGFHFY